jgi:hypothetical protein
MPSRREFMAVLGTTLAGALAGGTAGASAVSSHGRHPRGQSILNVSTDMRAFRRADMTPDEPGVNATAILNDAIRLAAGNDVTTIIATQGTYYFPLVNNRYVVMSNVNGLTIDLQGSTLIFQGIPGNATVQASALDATNCSALTLRNFSLDYDPLPFSQFDVVSLIDPMTASSGTVNVAPQAGFQSLAVFASAPTNSLWAFVFRGGVRLYSTSRVEVSVNGSTVTLTDQVKSGALLLIEPGDVLVIAARSGGAALAFEAPVGLTLQNVSIYSSGVQGVYAQGASSSIISGVNVVPAPGTARLVSTNAGGVVLGQAGPNNQIVDSTFISVQDDSIAVNALTVGSIGAVDSGGTITVSPPATGTGAPGAFPQISTALFVDPATCQVYGPLAVTPVGDTTLNFSGPLPAGVETGFLICDAEPAHRGQGLVIARNRVLRSCFARGMTFWGLSGVIIQGNYFNSVQMAGIDVLQKTASNDWICLPNDAVTVQANLLENCNLGTTFIDPEMEGAILVHSLGPNETAVQPNVHTAIVVQNNYVVNTPRTGMWLQNVLSGSTGPNLLQLTSTDPSGGLSSPFNTPAYQTSYTMPAVIVAPGFTPGGVTSDAAIQIAVSAVGGAVGDPVVPGAAASAALLTNAVPPAGPLTFVMVDSSGASFTPAVTGAWPNVQFVVPPTAIRGVAGLQISASGTAVARGGMFVA